MWGRGGGGRGGGGRGGGGQVNKGHSGLYEIDEF